MKRYPAYKQEHRLPGIQEVPEHWGVVRNSLIFKEVSETGYGHLELLSILSDRGIVKQSETGRKERAPEDRSSYKRIQQGDIGYNLMNAFMGSIGASNYEGIISPAYAVCRPKITIEPNYFHYLFRTNLYLTEFDRNAYGIMYERNRLYFDNFKRIYSPFPPLDEQKAIAHFINRKLEEIDHFIRNKQRLIELLNEQKAVIINRAVTQGINPHVPMKHSGIEWSGEIPTHWNLIRLRFLILDGTQNGLYKSKEYYKEDGTPIISMAEASTSLLINCVAKDRVQLTEDELQSYSLKNGDLLFARRSLVFEGSGKCSVVSNLPEIHIFESSIIRVSPDSASIDSLFFVLFLNSAIGRLQILKITKQVTISGIDAANLKDVLVLLPPLIEQQQIISYINNESGKINQAIAKAEREIELIQEYRTTLISDAVTGKIDVRPNSSIQATLTA